VGRACGITQPSSHITSTGSGADAGQVPHWPHPGGGASSSVMSTTAWSPAVGTSAGDAITSAVATTAAASSYCNPVTIAVSRSGSPVAAALAAAHATLDERRLVSTGTPDMSALTGARVGTIGVTLRTRKHKDEHQPLKIQGARGEVLLTSIWRSLVSSSSRVQRAPQWCPPAPPWRSPAPSRCSRAPPLMTRWQAPPRPPRAPAPRPPLRPVATGAGDSTSQGGPPPVALLFLLLL
jgi:hypothetical protein